MFGFGVNGGLTVGMSKWMEKVGGSDTDYIKNLEDALKAACKKIADGDQLYEDAKSEDGWFDYFLYEGGLL